jgi:zinc protease
MHENAVQGSNSILFVPDSSISMSIPGSLLRFCALTLSLLCAGTVVHAASIPQRTLANGMKIIVKEDHRSPVAVSMVWYRAGSMDEVSGTTGVAHMLEHMMFKGT